MSASYPEVRVEMTQREPETALHETWARDFDLVIAEQYPGHTRAHWADLDRVNLAADTLRLAVPPIGAGSGQPPAALPGDRVAAAKIADLREAASWPWVMEPEGTASRQWATQLCRSAGFEPDVRFETADLIAHIRLIQSGNAVGVLPDLVWSGATPTVRLLDLPGAPERTVFTAARRSSSGRPGVLAVRDALAQAVDRLGA